MSSTSRTKSPPWVVYCGQPGTCTRPPVTSAAARNWAALDRSGSTCTSRALTSLGSTRQVWTSPSSTTTPASRSVSTVISMCGRLGTALPSWCTVTPSSKRAPESSRPETNCEDAEASRVTAPPRTDPRPWTVNGRPPRPSSSTSTPRVRSAPSTGAIGRCRACGSPSKRTGAVGQARHRRDEPHDVAGEAAVDLGAPARPRPGVTTQSTSSTSSTRAPEGAQGPRHEEGVARAQRRPQAGDVVREGREHEVAVGEGLAAGEDDACVDGPGGGRCGPVSRGHAAPGPPSASPRGRPRGPRAGPRGGSCGPRGGRCRSTSLARYASPGLPSVSTAARSRPPSRPRFLRNCVCCLARTSGSCSFQNGVCRNGGRHDRRGQHRGGDAGEAAQREERPGRHHRHAVGAHQQLGVVGQPDGRRELLDEGSRRLGLAGGVLELVEPADDEHRGEHGAGDASHQGHGVLRSVPAGQDLNSLR